MKTHVKNLFSNSKSWQSFFLLLLLCGCFDNRLAPHGATSGASSLANATSSVFLNTNSTAADGALGNCALLPDKSHDRSICISCYSTLLATKCPGKSTPSQCLDKATASNFDNLVNQCLMASIQAGFTCIKTCTGGQVLNGPTCSCVTAGSTGGSGSSVDVGAQDYGPPVVSITLPQTRSTAVFNAANCSATTETPVFSVRNRGNTVPAYNTYRFVSSTCTLDPGVAKDPVADPATHKILSQIAAPSIGISYPLIGDEGVSVLGVWIPALKPYLNFASSTGSGSLDTQAVLTPGATYEVEVDLRLFNQWEGNSFKDSDFIELQVSDPDHIAVPTTTVFHYTFSNDPKDSTIGVASAQSYPIRASVAAGTMGDDPTDPTDGLGTSGNAVTGWNDSRYILHASYIVPSTTTRLHVTFKTVPRGATKEFAVPKFRMRKVDSCAITYSFTDSNQLTSYYCYRFSPRASWATYTQALNSESYQCYLAPTDDNFWTPLSVNDTCVP